MPVRLAAKSVKKIAKLAELEGVDRSTVLRMLIDIGLDSPRVSLLMRPPRVKGSTAVQRVIRAVAAERQVLATQSAPSPKPLFREGPSAAQQLPDPLTAPPWPARACRVR